MFRPFRLASQKNRLVWNLDGLYYYFPATSSVVSQETARDVELHKSTATNIALPQFGRTVIFSALFSLLIFSHRLDRIPIAYDFGYAPRRRLSLAVKIKNRSFNQQHHRADTATNSQTAGNAERCV